MRSDPSSEPMADLHLLAHSFSHAGFNPCYRGDARNDRDRRSTPARGAAVCPGADIDLGLQLQRAKSGVQCADARRFSLRALPDHAGMRGAAALATLRTALAAAAA